MRQESNIRTSIVNQRRGAYARRLRRFATLPFVLANIAFVAALVFGIALISVSCGSDPQTQNPRVDAGPRDLVDATPLPDGPPPPPHAPPTAAAVEYFSDISDSLSGTALVNALHTKLAADHVSIGYASLLSAYEVTDTNREGCTGIFDFYSTKCWDSSDACGNYSQEGDCFNREHSWPKSWWGGQAGPDQHQDLVSVIPADGYVNNARGRLALGEIVNPTYTSTNGSKRGRCSTSGSPLGDQCFEPPDELKGDFARIYFYVAVRYEGEFSCCSEDSVLNADIRLWQEQMLRQWHARDPVDIPERDRNERLFGIQKNRNPFVDFPGFVERISDF